MDHPTSGDTEDLRQRSIDVLLRIAAYVNGGPPSDLVIKLRDPSVAFIPAREKRVYVQALADLARALNIVTKFQDVAPAGTDIDYEAASSLRFSVAQSTRTLMQKIVSFDEVEQEISGSFGSAEITTIVRDLKDDLREAMTESTASLRR